MPYRIRKHFNSAALHIVISRWASLVAVVCSLMCIAHANAQGDPRFERISTEIVRYEKGLSQNTVHSIMQDSYGFMWFGTWEGLNKFDGYSFTVWDEKNGLSHQTVQALAEDHDGLVWIGTDDGLNVYDRKTDQITVFRHDHRSPNSLVHNSVRTISVDKQGNVWVGTNRGISVFNREQQRFENYKHDARDSRSLISNWINDIYCDHEGNIWIGTYKGLELYDRETNSFIHFNRSTGWDNIALLPVQAITGHQQQAGLWISNTEGLFYIDMALKKAERIALEQYHPMVDKGIRLEHLQFDEQGLLWIGTSRNGVILYDHLRQKITLLQNDKGNPLSLSNDQVYSLYADASGLVWVGTFSGLNKYDPNASKFRHHKQDLGHQFPLLSDVVFTFFEESDGTIFVGTEKGISLFDPIHQRFDLLRDANGQPTPIVKGLVRKIHKDRNGIFWVSTTGGLVRYDPITKETLSYRADAAPGNTLISNFVRSIAEDDEGILWVGTELGLCRFDPHKETFSCFQHEEGNPRSLPHNIIYDLRFDNSGKLWIATGGGICWFDPVRQQFIPAVHDAARVLTAGQLRVASILEGENGIFWAGTMGGGLMQYNSRTGQYRFFTKEDGLPNNVVYTLLNDRQGNLWLPTNRGLVRFNIANESFVTYGIQDGVQSHEFNLGASLKTRNGRLLFGGMNGFNSFFPEDIRQNPDPPRIAISGFYIFDERVKRELFGNETIHLKANQNFFTFIFTALDFANPAKNQYKYILENFDKRWTSADANERTAIYSNMPPGKYIFRVMGSNNDGIWNEEGIAVTVVIHPPWYATTAFRGSMAGAVVLLLYIMVRGRIQQIKRKHLIEKQFLEMEKQHSDLEQKALRLQMNPHFIFNTLNSIQSYMISNESDTAVEYLAKFARLMRQVLANSRESFIPVREELMALEYYLEIEQLRFDDKFAYSIEVDPDIDQEFTGIPPMILQPYVENAIIHGLLYKQEKGHVCIMLTQHTEGIFCVVEDDGVGRIKAGEMARESGLERKSSGMIITQQRLDILNKNKHNALKVNVIDKHCGEGKACGTRVEIQMPTTEL